MDKILRGRSIELPAVGLPPDTRCLILGDCYTGPLGDPSVEARARSRVGGAVGALVPLYKIEKVLAHVVEEWPVPVRVGRWWSPVVPQVVEKGRTVGGGGGGARREGGISVGEMFRYGASGTTVEVGDEADHVQPTVHGTMGLVCCVPDDNEAGAGGAVGRRRVTEAVEEGGDPVTNDAGARVVGQQVALGGQAIEDVEHEVARVVVEVFGGRADPVVVGMVVGDDDHVEGGIRA